MAVTLLPRYSIPGYEDFTPEEAAELLHQEKNQPEGPPAAVLRKVTRPYGDLTPEEKAFPTAMYREWNPADKQLARLRAAQRMNMKVDNPLDLEEIDRYIGAYDSRLAKTQSDKDILIGQGWSDTPDQAKHAAFLAHRELATDAAVSFTDDSKILSSRAMAERERIDDAQDDHTPDIPRTPIKPKGRRAKVKA